MPAVNPLTILVTGASAGIGFETARELAKRGHNLLLTGRNEEKGNQAVSKITNETGNAKVSFWQGDLSVNPDEVFCYFVKFFICEQPFLVGYPAFGYHANRYGFSMKDPIARSKKITFQGVANGVAEVQHFPKACFAWVNTYDTSFELYRVHGQLLPILIF